MALHVEIECDVGYFDGETVCRSHVNNNPMGPTIRAARDHAREMGWWTLGNRAICPSCRHTITATKIIESARQGRRKLP